MSTAVNAALKCLIALIKFASAAPRAKWALPARGRRQLSRPRQTASGAA
ncbi:hypothetical protein KCP70_01355 [Salmonella enterica subsp. enterica]|nr:hypothetical protein KCP70_01355 [Salmonella enterica subsp. enterica]